MLTRFHGSFLCLEQLVLELIHICDSWCCYIQPICSADKSKSSSSYALAFRWLLSLIISLNADKFSSPPNAQTESHPIKSCSPIGPSQISSPNDVPCLLMSMCHARAWLPNLAEMFPMSLKSHQCNHTTIATLHAKKSGIHFLLLYRQLGMDYYIDPITACVILQG